MLFSHWLFRLKNWRLSTNSCEAFIVSLIQLRLHFDQLSVLKMIIFARCTLFCLAKKVTNKILTAVSCSDENNFY